MKFKHIPLILGVCTAVLTLAIPFGQKTGRHGHAPHLGPLPAVAAVTGTITITPKPVNAGQQITITVTDADLNSDITTTQSASATVKNNTTSQTETVNLTETGANTGIFTGTLATANASGSGTAGTLNVQSGQTVTATYSDTINSSSVASTQTDTATVTAPSIPAVTGLTPTFVNRSSVRLNWDKNSNAGVTGYKVYFGTSTRIYTGTSLQGASPVKTFGNMTTLSRLPYPAVPATLPAVTGISLSPFDQGLTVAWSPVTGATAYKIYFSTATFDSATLPANPATTGSTSYNLTGLTNGTKYYVAVVAIAQPTYYFAVTAALNPSLNGSTPGSANESTYSAEASQVMGTPTVEGQLSAIQSAFAEVIAAYPQLKNEGCFIATAAFGHYSAPQVQLLRDFRDRFMLTNAPGRAFVAWYYRYGPHGARFLNQHPVFKPLVRVLLLPVVAFVQVLFSMPGILSAAAVAGPALLALLVMRRRTVLENNGGMP